MLSLEVVDMFRSIAITLFIANLTSAWTNAQNQTDDDNLTVYTRTGTFIGDLNDTYPDVRQFKYIPYAKVCKFIHQKSLNI